MELAALNLIGELKNEEMHVGVKTVAAPPGRVGRYRSSDRCRSETDEHLKRTPSLPPQQ